MTIQSHLQELERRHKIMDAEIADAVRRPSSDGVELQAMKRRKLGLKDEIERLRRQSVPETAQ